MKTIRKDINNLYKRECLKIKDFTLNLNDIWLCAKSGKVKVIFGSFFKTGVFV